MPGRFSDPELQPGNKLKVTGEFGTAGEVIGDVVVRFLIIPEREGRILGTATLSQDDLTRDTVGNDVITHGKFNLTVDNEIDLVGGEKVRGIGLAVIVKDSGDDDDPPAFETFTWCVSRVVTLP